jgi:hypothetical protein
VITAQTIISEVGTDMSGFATENHFASSLGLAPSKDISGGKIIGPGKKKVQNRVAMAFRMAATTLLNSKTYLGSRYRHPRKQLPPMLRQSRRWPATWQFWSTDYSPMAKLGWIGAQRHSNKGAPSGNWRR